MNATGDQRKHVIYISYDGMTDQLGQSQVLPYLCKLAEHGFQFHLISCEKPGRFSRFRHIVEGICAANNITWYPVPYTKSPPVFSTMKDVRVIAGKTKEIFARHPISLIHCRGYISSLIGLRMKRKHKTPFLFDMRGLWADEKVDAGTWNLKNPIFRVVYRFFKKKEKNFLEEADYTISLTHAGEREIHHWTHIKGQPVNMEVIPCCADLDLFDPASADPVITAKIAGELGIRHGDIILAYLGSIGGWYMLDEMLDFFIIYKKQFTSARFLFISMDHHDLIRAKATERQIAASDVLIRPAIRAEVAPILKLITHSVFFIRPTYSKISSSPTKQAELMGMGIPVICNDGVGDTGVIVDRYNSGITVSGFTNPAYTQAVESIAGKAFDPVQIRQGAFDYFSLDEGAKKYLAIYQRICR